MGTPVFDPERAIEMMDGDTSLLQELVVVFQAALPRSVAEIREALAEGDPVAAGRAAHRLKGGLLTLTGEPAAEAALRVELAGRAEDLPGAREASEPLFQALQAFDEALTRWREQSW